MQKIKATLLITTTLILGACGGGGGGDNGDNGNNPLKVLFKFKK